MTKTIWKFSFFTDDMIMLKMPVGAEILHLNMQNNDPQLWALVNADNDQEVRRFEIFGTGHPIKYDMGIERKYIGTYFEGALVFHLFERIN